jgi:hypothetical protein
MLGIADPVVALEVDLAASMALQINERSDDEDNVETIIV